VLTFQILSQEFHDITFPAEEQTVGLFEEHSSAAFIPDATQCDLQAVLDHHHYDKLFTSANLRDQAHLTTLSCSSGGGSGWLKAIPQSSLSLAIPGPEFVAGLHLWLGIPSLCVLFSN